MATKSSCLPHLLVAKLLKNGKKNSLEKNNNYLFTAPGGRSGSGSSSGVCTRRGRKAGRRDDQGVPNHAGSALSVYVLVAAVAVLVYINSLSGHFVHDDVVAIRRNADVVGSETDMRRIFTNDFWGKPITDGTSHKSYRPLCVLTFRLNFLIGGLDPTGYHAVNIGLHALACVLFMYLCEQVLSYSKVISTLAGLLFATHPIHTEAVSGVVGRADVLTCVLYITAFLLYHRSMCRGRPGPPSSTTTKRPAMFVLSLLTAGAALLVKEHGVTVLGVCLLYDIMAVNSDVISRVLRRRCTAARTCTPVMKRTVLLLLWGSFLVYTRVWLMGGQPPVFKPEDNPAAASQSVLTRMLTHVYIYALNAWLLLCPINLSYDWQMGSIPIVTKMVDPRNCLSLLLILSLLVLGTLAIYKTKGVHQRRLVASLLLLVVPFIPASNIFFPVGFVIAERILYIPSLGFILLLAQGLERLSVRPCRGGLTALYCGLLLCGAWAGRTVSRNTVWSSREALFRSGLDTLPHNAKMHYNYANYLKDTGQRQAAVRHYEQAIRLWPEYASAHNNLGTLANDSVTSESHYRQAIAINPAHAGAFFNLGNLLSTRGHSEQAVAALERAVDVDPYFPDPHTSLAVLLDSLGRHAEAEGHYKQVVRLRPNDANAHNNLGVFLGNQGKPAEALVSYRSAFTVDPSHHLSMVNAARTLRMEDKDAEAQVLLERALSISRDPRTLKVAGVLYFNTNQPRRAAAIFKELLTLQADGEPSDSIHYAQSLSRLGRNGEAERVLRDVTRRLPYHPEALQQLANVLGLRRKHEEALDVLNKVISQKKDGSFLAAIHCQMGNHHKDIGSMEQAFQSYYKAVQLNNNMGEAHLNLGVFYHLKDNLTSASYHYSEADRLMPDNQLVKENLKKLCRIDLRVPHCHNT